ncbi:MAG: hypothetical protein A3K18_11815 [Lentisphaerae bacterium RIFOXYA12_64_32]|nr:MAG: hypothetical protein A3K18_11815 [Lentisphaerae bacterium RIFOXYA12_64_32]
MTTIDYSDSTPDVTFTYTRLGQQATVTDVTGTREFAYSATTLDLTSETLPTAFYGDRILTRTRDALGRDTGFLIGPAADPDADYDVAYSHDTYGRFSGLAVAAPVSGAFSYSYLANSDLLATTTYPSDITATRAYEPNRNLIDYIENKVDTTTVSKYDYTNDQIARRTARAQSGSAFTAADTVTFGYNDRSEVVSADAATDPAYDFAYAYDPIGNRQTYTNDGNPTTTYTSNQLNQYTALQQGGAPVNPTYDLDGNMTRLVVPPSGGPDWSLAWDAENRLIRAEQLLGAPASSRALVFVYDYMSRRVAKLTYTSTDAGATWILASHTKFAYDAWNLVLELDALNANATLKTFTWGLDLSQSLQGAGGVGGLLAVTDSSGTYFPTFDANGNVSEYLDSTGAAAAHYEYDPFGGTTVASGDHAADFAHRFSTKFLDTETALYYYGYRLYCPAMGRWASRDPIGEAGFALLSREERGVNEAEGAQYGFGDNSPVDTTDFLGLACGSGWNEWLVPENPGGFPFGTPCQNHDDCYGSKGCQAGKSKAECDKQLLEDARSVCNSQPEKVRGWCHRQGPKGHVTRYRCWKYPKKDCERWANLYYWAVTNLGQGAFDKARESCCPPVSAP